MMSQCMNKKPKWITTKWLRKYNSHKSFWFLWLWQIKNLGKSAISNNININFELYDLFNLFNNCRPTLLDDSFKNFASPSHKLPTVLFSFYDLLLNETAATCASSSLLSSESSFSAFWFLLKYLFWKMSW